MSDAQGGEILPAIPAGQPCHGATALVLPDPPADTIHLSRRQTRSRAAGGGWNFGATSQTAQNQRPEAEKSDKSQGFHILEILNDAVQSKWFL
jgi:hypothetical protein